MPNSPPHSNPDIPRDLPEDPESSYDPSGGTWEAWSADEGALADGEATKELGDLPFRMRAISPVPPGAVSPLAAEEDRGRFALRRKIAEGGFGEIWEAVQLSLGRVIAIKRLKPRPSGGESTDPARKVFEDTRVLEFDFRQEALITAQLEHPNIIPVYDVGRDESGRPLIAMKMVKGRLWSDVLRHEFHTMSVDDFLARHLQILISVGQAVAFAHSHGVIHRDLKPTQVMLGRFGEALLMDWGLAMAFGTMEEFQVLFPSCHVEPNSPLFNPVNPAGTPAFMAPEQTRRTTEDLGPWTDVYLLGGILYRLLTGRNPHIGSDSATTYILAGMGVVDRPEIRAPGREIPAELAALAMKAMEKEPADRVESVEAFVAGLQDFLTGAGKRRESGDLSRHVGESLRSAGTDYGLLADCLNQLDRSLVLWPANPEAVKIRQETLLRYARTAKENRDLKLARVQTERLPGGAERENLLTEIRALEEEQRRQDERLEAAYRQARIDRDRADDMRGRAENLVGFLIGDLHTALQSIGRLDLIRSVTHKSLEYFDSLSEEEGAGESLLNRAVAYLNIADVFADEGKKSDALTAFQRAREFAESFCRENPESSEGLTALADCRDHTGQVLYYQGRTDEALEEHRGALEIRRRLAARQPDDAAVSGGIASCLHKTGVIYWRQQNLPRALDLHLESLDILRRLFGADPGNRDLEAGISWNLSTLGNVYRDLGDEDKAIEVTGEALQIRESLMQREPVNISRIDDFLWTQGNLALLYLFRGDLEKSLALFAKHMPLRRRLSEDDPTNVVRVTAVTFPLSLMGEIQFVLGQLDEAEMTLEECLSITSTLFSRDPTSAHIVSAYGRLHCQLGEVLVAQERWEEADNLACLAVDMARRALDLAPKSVMTIKVLVSSLILWGRIKVHEEKRSEATALWEEARELLHRIEIKGDEVDILHLATQLALLLKSGEDVGPWMEKIQEKRWVSPSLRDVCRETGYKPIP